MNCTRDCGSSQGCFKMYIAILKISGSLVKLCNNDGVPKLVLSVRSFVAVGIMDLPIDLLLQAC